MHECHLKKILLLLFVTLLSIHVFAQNDILKEAQNLELKFDEPVALEKYKLLTEQDPTNITALVKCAELNCSIGERQKDKKIKTTYFETASGFAQKAYETNSQNADACYAVTLAAGRMTEVEDDNKKLVE